MRQTISRDAIKDTCSFDWRFVDEFSHSYINRPYAKPSVKSAGVFVSLEDDMKYFAYLHVNGGLKVKRFNPDSYEDAFDSDFVAEVSNIIEADGRLDAEEEAKTWAQWAREAQAPAPQEEA